MGDRANIVMELKTGYEEDRPYGLIFLYTHWGGTDLPGTLQTALKRRERWDDESYLTRIIFSEMIRGQERSETGFGISLRPSDNEHPYLRVNPDKQTVTVDFDPVRKYHNQPNRKFTFEKFVAIPDISWEALEKTG